MVGSRGDACKESFPERRATTDRLEHAPFSVLDEIVGLDFERLRDARCQFGCDTQVGSPFE